MKHTHTSGIGTEKMHQPPFVPQIRLYQQWLERNKGLRFSDYQQMWKWSVTELDAFWGSMWEYLKLDSPTPYQSVLTKNSMPGAVWFEGAKVNYAQQVFKHVEAAHAASMPAIISSNEKGQRRELTWPELQSKVSALAFHLQKLGVVPGDRVAAYLPNIPETMIAFLAVVSVGAVWSVCAPDMGTNAVLDRFSQITPKVLIACDGVTYGAKDHERTSVVAELKSALPSVEHLILYQNLGGQVKLPTSIDWEDVLAGGAGKAFDPLWVPFNHPLWIVYSSGTTGLPKPIVHSHGGTLLNGMAHKNVHYDVGCSYEANSWGERFLWYSSTGWVMWNAQLSGLLSGTTCVLYDGNPGGSKERPDWGILWRFAADEKVTFFGGGAAFFTNCMKANLSLSEIPNLDTIRALGTTGSPLSAEVQQWGTDQFRKIYDQAGQAEKPDIWWCNISGGTDAGAYVGGHRELPMVAGEMQCRFLGVSVEAWNANNTAVVDEVGELVVTQPLPAMPIFFWGDNNNERYLGSYFDMYPPGCGRKPGGGDAEPEAGAVWRHGDWLKITAEGRCVIYGRSDATINRHGLRMGTSELYRAVEALPEVLDSMVVDLEYLGRESYMPLFVVLREGHQLNAKLLEQIRSAIRQALSPRFIPDEIFQVAEIPRTLSGKKQELPIKKLMLGQPIEKVINKDAMANPNCLDWYVSLAAKHQEQRMKTAG
jgi:acetoacetyl-CoA synthetase